VPAHSRSRRASCCRWSGRGDRHRQYPDSGSRARPHPRRSRDRAGDRRGIDRPEDLLAANLTARVAVQLPPVSQGRHGFRDCAGIDPPVPFSVDTCKADPRGATGPRPSQKEGVAPYFSERTRRAGLWGRTRKVRLWGRTRTVRLWRRPRTTAWLGSRARPRASPRASPRAASHTARPNAASWSGR
jgi:hypothetical protein